MKQSLANQVDENATGVEMTTSTPGSAEQPLEGSVAPKKSRAADFDAIPDSGSGVPDGKYEAIIKEFVYQDPIEGKGQSVRHTVIIASENQRGEEITNWFKVFEDHEQSVPAGGAKFFKQTCAMLGHPVTKDTIAEVCEAISNGQIGVLIQKKTNKVNGVNYENIYYNGLIEDSPAIRATIEGGFLNF